MTLNTEAINQLADRIEQCEQVEMSDHKPGRVGPAFTMRKVAYVCGAPACLMGHNAAMHGRNSTSVFGNLEIAADLGITETQAHELCAPQNAYADYFACPDEPTFIAKDHVVAVLRNLRDTGEVDWKIGAADDSAA